MEEKSYFETDAEPLICFIDLYAHLNYKLVGTENENIADMFI